MSQQGRILGIGGIFFKSANQQQMQEWYANSLGLADSGQGVMLPWREQDHPEREQMTVWSIFPADTNYFEPSPASFMVNYIVDDLEALLDRLEKEGVRIDRAASHQAVSDFHHSLLYQGPCPERAGRHCGPQLSAGLFGA